jgi:acid phosphatase type 7
MHRKKIFIFVFLVVLIFLGIRTYSFIPEKYFPQELPIFSQDKSNFPLPIGTNPQIIVTADIACNEGEKTYECQHNNVARLASLLNPDAIIIPGDLQYPSGRYNDFLRYFDASFGKLKNKIYPVPGNHEYMTKNAAGYFDYFNGIDEISGRAGKRGEGYYSFDLGKWHIVGLNSNCWAVGGCEIGSKQVTWLINDLKNNKNQCIMAFMHHPLVSSGEHGNNPMVHDIWNILYKNNVSIVMSGHDHHYERFKKMNFEGNADTRGIRLFIVGTGGKSLYAVKNQLPTSEVVANDDYGVLSVSLGDNTYEWNFIPTNAKGFKDSGKDTCNSN